MLDGSATAQLTIELLPQNHKVISYGAQSMQIMITPVRLPRTAHCGVGDITPMGNLATEQLHVDLLLHGSAVQWIGSQFRSEGLTRAVFEALEHCGAGASTETDNLEIPPTFSAIAQFK